MGTQKLQLTISSDSHNLRPGIVPYADADLGRDVAMCQLTSGLVIFVKGILVNWKSGKQSLFAQSTTQAEIITTATTKPVCEWLYDIASEFGHHPTIIILNDNLNCVMTPKSGNFQANSCHLCLRYYGLHEAIAKDKISIYYVPTTEMLADSLTKPLNGPGITKFRTEIGLQQAPDL